MTENNRKEIVALIVKKIKCKTDVVEDQKLEGWAALSMENRELLNELLDRNKLMRHLLTYKKPDIRKAWEKFSFNVGL